MIPRYRPYTHLRDLFKYLFSPVVSREEVETDFAQKAGARFALMLPYGRSTYYFLLKAYGIEQKEVIVPAYTCYCIPGPILETNNKPVCIDAMPDNCNMDHSKIARAVTGNTSMIITSSIWGTPLELSSLRKLKRENTFLVGDYALGLMTFLDKQKEALNVFDVTFFSFGIGKEISFLGGGIAVTNNEEIFIRLKEQRDKECIRPSFNQNIKMIFKLLGCVIGFKKTIYRYLVFLSTKTRLLNRLKGVEIGLTKNLPDDFFMFPTNLQLHLAKDRINKLDAFLAEKREVLKLYYTKFQKNNQLKLDEAELASLLPLRCHGADTCKIQESLFNGNIHTNTIFKRILPEVLKENAVDFPNATRHTHELTMLPLYYGLTESEIDKVIKELTPYHKNI